MVVARLEELQIIDVLASEEGAEGVVLAHPDRGELAPVDTRLGAVVG